MTIALDPERMRRRTDGVAANDDHLNLAVPSYRESSTPAVAQSDGPTAGTGGWDAYEVWRRLIKEARERRTSRLLPPTPGSD